jgi:ComEC/Rec2-related protein
VRESGRQTFSILRTRCPFAGLILAVVLAVSLSDHLEVYWHSLLWLTLAVSTIALIFRRTWLTLFAVFFCSGFLHVYHRATDQGFRLSRRPLRSSYLLRLLVTSDPVKTIRGQQVSARFFARVLRLDNRVTDFRIVMQVPDARLSYGDILEGLFPLELPSTANNPGEFDYRAYLRRERVYLSSFVARTSSHAIVARQQGNPVIRCALQIRHQAADALTLGIADEPEVCQVVQGIVLGSHSALAPDLMDALQRTGTLHLFVIDGLKIALFASLTWLLVCLMRLNRKSAALVVLPVIAGYCIITGFSPSSLRATLMTGLLFTGIALERPAILLNTLSAAGFILLLGDTEEVFKLGFQLSFLTVLALILLVRPLSRALVNPFEIDTYIPRQLIPRSRRLIQRVVRSTVDLFAVSLVCWFSSSPIALVVFHKISLSSPIANMVAVPVGTWILFTGVLSLLLTPAHGWFRVCLNNSNWLLAKIFLWSVSVMAHLPGTSINVEFPPSAETNRVTILATGHIPVVCLHSGPGTWLINSGTASKWRRIVVPYLECAGINQLKAIFLARTDKAHAEASLTGLEPFSQTAVSYLGNFPERSDEALLLAANPTIRISPVLPSRATGHNHRNGTNAPVILCEFAGLRLLVAPELAANVLPTLKCGRIDVAILKSSRIPSSELSNAEASVKAVIIPQRSSRFPAIAGGVPLLVLSETGAITIVPSRVGLELRSFHGAAVTLSKRSR